MAIEAPKSAAIAASRDEKILRRPTEADGSPESVPMYPHETITRRSTIGQLDYPSLPLPDASMDDFSKEELARLRGILSRSRNNGDQAPFLICASFSDAPRRIYHPFIRKNGGTAHHPHSVCWISQKHTHRVEKGAFMGSQTPASYDDRQTPSFSRRSFVLGGLMGATSLFLNPLWHVGDRFAYAVESDNPEFKVFVVSSKEIGVAVVDVTDGQNKPLPGAKITLTKHSDESKTLSGTSDEDGNVVFNVESFADAVDVGEGEIVYRFDGRVDIEKTGYRRVTINRIRCDGGSGAKVPTRLTTDQNFVYFKSISFNDWDIQYSRNSFLLIKSKATKHKLSGEIEAPQKSSASISLVGKDNASGNETTVKSFNVSLANGVGSFSDSDHYLDGDYSVCLKKETTYYLDVKFSETEKYRFETGLSAIDPPIYNVLSGGTSFTPALQSTSSAPLVVLSDPIPKPLQGTLSIWRPTFPLLFYVTPLGFAMLGVSTVDMEIGSSSPLTAGSWEKESSQSVKQQINSITKNWQKQTDTISRLRSIRRRRGKFAAYEFSKKISASVGFQAYLLSTFNFAADGKWTGTANLLAQASFSVSLTWTFVIGGVPLFVTLTPSLDALLAYSVGISAPTKDPTNVKFDPSTHNVSVTFTIGVAIEFGLGISGVASLSARAAGYFTIYEGLYEMEGYRAGMPLPRCILSAGFDAEIILQLLLFKWTGKIWSISWPRIYDDWASYDPAFTAGEPQTLETTEPLGLHLGKDESGKAYWSHSEAVGDGGLSIEDFLAEAVITTEDDLAQTAEISARQKNGVTASVVTFQEPRSIGDGLYVAEMNSYGPANSFDEFEYEFIGDDEDVSFSVTAGVAGVGERGGVKPTIDSRISRNIFSNPLQKTVLFHSTPYMFRIVSVKYTIGNQTMQRTRLSAQRYNADTGKWERPKVINIPFNVADIARTDTFDYDFAVIAQSESLSNPYVPNGIHVLLVSGTRPKGDASTLTEVATNQIMTWLILDEYLQTTASYTWVDNINADGKYHYPSTPHLVPLPVSDGSTTSTRFIAAAFLNRSGDNPEDLLTNKAAASADLVLLSGMKVIRGTSIPVNPACYDLTLSPLTGTLNEKDKTVNISFVIASRSKDDGVRIATASATAPIDFASDPTKETIEVSYKNNIDDRKDIINLQVWPNHTAFLTVNDGVLYSSTFDPKVEHGELTTRQVGPTSLKVSTFLVSQNGDVLFFVENQDGIGGQNFEDDPNNPTPVKVSLHRVHASILVNDLFSESFPLAEVSHPLDSMAAVNGGGSYTFLSTYITDASVGAADMYYIDVPVVALATPLGFDAVYQFVEQGEIDAPFELKLRNDGNVILKGCTVDLRDAETGEVVDSRDLSFALENLCASVWNPELVEDPDPDLAAFVELKQQNYPPECLAAVSRAANGPHLLADPASNNALLPGKTAVYRIEFSIPKDWHGTKKVYLQPRDYRYDTIVTATDAEVEVLHYTVPYNELITAEVPVHSETDDEDASLFDPGAWMLGPNGELIAIGGTQESGSNDNDGDGDNGGNSGSGSAGGNGGAGEKKDPSIIVATGDATIPTVAGLAATAAVAGLAAYSARRTAIDREKRERREAGDGPRVDGE